jgi:hypothetical protein
LSEKLQMVEVGGLTRFLAGNFAGLASTFGNFRKPIDFVKFFRYLCRYFLFFQKLGADEAPQEKEKLFLNGKKNSMACRWQHDSSSARPRFPRVVA